MYKPLACVAILFVAAASIAAPVSPGNLHVLEAKGGAEEIKAEPTDVIELRIPNPALAKRVHDVDVTTAGDGILAGVANTSDKKPGSDRISIFVGLKGAARSATITYSYKDGDDKEHKGKVTVQVIKKGTDK